MSLERLMLLRTSLFRTAEEEFSLLAQFCWATSVLLDISLSKGHFFKPSLYAGAVSCEGSFDVKPPKFLPCPKRVLQVAGRSRSGCRQVIRECCDSITWPYATGQHGSGVANTRHPNESLS